MLNYLNEMTREDINATFNGTCVRAFINGNWKAVRVRDVLSTRLYVDILSSGNQTEVPFGDVDVTQSDLGMMWYRGNLWYIARYPERQWRRGLRERGITLYKLKPDGSSEMRRGASQEMLSAIAINFLERENSHEAVINRDYGRRGNLLFFRNIPIGEVDKNKNVKLIYDVPLHLEGYNVVN